MNTWKTMQEWRQSGPENGTEMLVLLSDGQRVVALYRGESQSWYSAGEQLFLKVVAWSEIPSVPDELTARTGFVASELERLNALAVSPLNLDDKPRSAPQRNWKVA